MPSKNIPQQIPWEYRHSEAQWVANMPTGDVLVARQICAGQGYYWEHIDAKGSVVASTLNPIDPWYEIQKPCRNIHTAMKRAVKSYRRLYPESYSKPEKRLPLWTCVDKGPAGKYYERKCPRGVLTVSEKSPHSWYWSLFDEGSLTKVKEGIRKNRLSAQYWASKAAESLGWFPSLSTNQ